MEVSQLLVKKIAKKESHKNRREKIWNKEKVVFPIFFNRSASRVCPSLCFCLFVLFLWGFFVLFCFLHCALTWRDRGTVGAAYRLQ